MLPEMWLSFDFDRNIVLSNIIYEILPFTICVAIYVYYYNSTHSLTFISSLLFCLYIIPNNSTLVLSDYELSFYLSINAYNILLLLLLGIESNKTRQSQYSSISFLPQNLKLQKTIRFLIYFTCIGVIAYVYFLKGSISLSGLFSVDIYENRANVADMYMQYTDGLIAYIMTFWSAFYSSVLIIGLYVSLKNKRFMDVLLCVFTYFVLFSFETQKSILFKPIIAIFICFLVVRRKMRDANMFFFLGFIAILAITLIEHAYTNESAIYSVVIRRICYMPQYLSHAYFDFFSTHDKYWLTRDFFQLEKVVRLFYPGSYAHGPVTVIAENCFPGVPSPNTGLFAEAFAQLGYLGILIFPPITAKLISLLSKSAQWYGEGAAHVLVASILISITNIQILATRGILLFIVFILITWCIKRVSNKSQTLKQ